MPIPVPSGRPTTAAAVATSLGRPLTASETAQVEQWADDARMLIRNRLGDPDDLDQDALDYVVREAVLNRIENGPADPGGSVTIDDYTRRWGPSTSRSGVQILTEWWELLSPAVEAQAFTIRPGRAR